MIYILVQGISANVFLVREVAELFHMLEGGDLYSVAAAYPSQLQ